MQVRIFPAIADSNRASYEKKFAVGKFIAAHSFTKISWTRHIPVLLEQGHYVNVTLSALRVNTHTKEATSHEQLEG